MVAMKPSLDFLDSLAGCSDTTRRRATVAERFAEFGALLVIVIYLSQYAMAH